MSEPTTAHTPSFRGRGRGRGRSQAVRAHVARLAQARKAANGRRGRQKLYDHPKPQAASERLKELKAVFSTVANAMRPALEDLADRSLDVLNKGHADAYRAFREYQEVKAFLDSRIRDVQSMYTNKLLLDTQLNDFMFKETRNMTKEGFIRDVEDAKDRFYDAQLMRLEILDKLHDNELPIDIIDDSWNFHEISDERFRDVKAHVEYRTDLGGHTPYGAKIEVPCAKTVTGRRLAGTPTTGSAGTGLSDDSIKPSPKRKADEEPDVLPVPKRLGATPRHIGGLLSAVVAPTDEDDDYGAEAAGSPGGDSKLPSPTPAEEEDEMLEDDENGTPMGDDEDDNTHLRPSERLPPLPNGASDPDAYGVRLINKRRTANFDVYNRILVPSLFDFEPHEIGFRDSTNDKSRGATKIKRGRFLDTPNSNTMHFDRSLWQFDATTYEEGELDEELIKKHNLHPKHGLFLRTSTNDEEPPKPRASGKKPVVFYTPRGRTFNSSRSIRIARLEDGADIASKRPAIAATLDQFAEQEGVSPAEVLPAEDALEAFRHEKMKLWLGPRRVARDETEELEEEERIEEMADADYPMPEEDDDEGRKMDMSPRTPVRAGRHAEDDGTAMAVDSKEDDEEQAQADAEAARAIFGVILDAAASVETDRGNAEIGGARPHSSDDAVSQVSQASPQAPKRAASRPFDPVRDVFMDQSPADDTISDRRHGSTDYSIPPAAHSTRSSSIPVIDTSNLLYMADIALGREYGPPSYPTQPQQQQQQQLPPPPPSSTRYPPARGQSSGYEYPPNDMNTYPPPPRRMSMDTPQSYHHQPLAAPPSQHATPPQQPQNLLDPRLFGETAPQPSALPPPDATYGSGRDAGNGYSSGGGGYYHHHHQQQAPPPPGYMHSSLPLPTSQPADPYSQAQGPPPPSAAYRPPPSRGGSQYYTSPPPPQHQQQPPMMRPYDSRYGPPRGEPEDAMPPPSGSSYSQQGLPPMMPQQQQAPGSVSPQIYASAPAYARGGSREYHPEYPAGVDNGPSNGEYAAEYAESNSSNGNNKYRKLEPAPMMMSKSNNEWPAGSDRERELDPHDDHRGSIASSNGHGDGRPLPGGPGGSNGAAMDEAPSAYATPPVGPASKEFRTVPYDYEKIKDYAAIEPPPSQGPKAIRGWAHNSLKRGGGGTTTTVSKAMSSTVSAIPPIKAENEWDRERERDRDHDRDRDEQQQQQEPHQ